MKYRTRWEIFGMILSAADGGATKTRIMCSAYLSFTQVNEYVEFLLRRKMLAYDMTTRRYTLTERGMRYLRILEQINELMREGGPDDITDRESTSIKGFNREKYEVPWGSSSPDDRLVTFVSKRTPISGQTEV